jgi:hypothetical protein
VQDFLYKYDFKMMGNYRCWFIAEAESDYAASMWDMHIGKEDVWAEIKKQAKRGDIIYISYADGHGRSWPYAVADRFTFVDYSGDPIYREVSLYGGESGGTVEVLQFDPNSGKFVCGVAHGMGDYYHDEGVRIGPDKIQFPGINQPMHDEE